MCVCVCGIRSVKTCVINIDTYYLRGPKSIDRTIPVIDDDDDNITTCTIFMSIMLLIDILYRKCECVLVFILLCFIVSVH